MLLARMCPSPDGLPAAASCRCFYLCRPAYPIRVHHVFIGGWYWYAFPAIDGARACWTASGSNCSDADGLPTAVGHVKHTSLATIMLMNLIARRGQPADLIHQASFDVLERSREIISWAIFSDQRHGHGAAILIRHCPQSLSTLGRLHRADPRQDHHRALQACIPVAPFSWRRALRGERTYSSYGDRCFAAAGPKLWNSLPTELRQADVSFQRFKRPLKTFLFRCWDRGAIGTNSVKVAPYKFTYLLVDQDNLGFEQWRLHCDQWIFD